MLAQAPLVARDSVQRPSSAKYAPIAVAQKEEHPDDLVQIERLVGAPANDSFASAIAIAAGSAGVTVFSTSSGYTQYFPIVGDNIGATTEPGEPPHAPVANGRSVWWKWTASSANVISLTISRNSGNYPSTAFPCVFAVYTGSSVDKLTPVARLSGNATDWEQYEFAAFPNTPYYIAIDGRDNLAGNISFSLVQKPDGPPAVVTQLTGGTFASGRSTVLSFNVSSASPVTYQWYRNGLPLSVNYPDQVTGGTVGITYFSAGHVGTYYVVATNVFGSVISDTVQVMMSSEGSPVITQDLANQTVTTGDDVSFKVQMASLQRIDWQWYFNGAPIPGAAVSSAVVDSVSYFFREAKPEQAGLYSVRITNSAGSVTSRAAELKVNPRPQAPQIGFYIFEGETSMTAGGTIAIHVTASGNPPVTSYRWLHNAKPINEAITPATSTTGSTYLDSRSIVEGATGPRLVISNAQPVHTGAYSVEVSNANGTTRSSLFSVVVTAPTGSGTGSTSGGSTTTNGNSGTTGTGSSTTNTSGSSGAGSTGASSGSGGGGGAPSLWFLSFLSVLLLLRAAKSKRATVKAE